MLVSKSVSTSPMRLIMNFSSFLLLLLATSSLAADPGGKYKQFASGRSAAFATKSSSSGGAADAASNDGGNGDESSGYISDILSRSLSEAGSAFGRKSLVFYRYFSTNLSRNKVVGMLDCDYDDPDKIKNCPPVHDSANPFGSDITRSGNSNKDGAGNNGVGNGVAQGGQISASCLSDPSVDNINCNQFPPSECREGKDEDGNLLPACEYYFQGWGQAERPGIGCIQNFDNPACADYYSAMPPMECLQDKENCADFFANGRNNGQPPDECLQDPSCASFFTLTRSDDNSYTNDVPSGSVPTAEPVATTEPTRDDCYGNMVDGRFCTSEMPSVSEEPTSIEDRDDDVPPGNTSFVPTPSPFWLARGGAQDGVCPTEGKRIDPTSFDPAFMPITVTEYKNDTVKFDVNQYWKQDDSISWLATVYTAPGSTGERTCADRKSVV